MNSYSVRLSQGRVEIDHPLENGSEFYGMVHGYVTKIEMPDTQGEDKEYVYIVKCDELTELQPKENV